LWCSADVRIRCRLSLASHLHPPGSEIERAPSLSGEIYRHNRLGGLIHEYYRAAA